MIVAVVTRVHGFSANQVFRRWQAFECGELSESGPSAPALLPVTVAVPSSGDARFDQFRACWAADDPR